MNPSKLMTHYLDKLAAATSIEGVTQTVAEAAREIAGADGATFVLRDSDQCFYVDEDAISPLWKGKYFPLEACISGWCMLNSQTVLIPNIYQDSRIPQDAYRPTFVKSLCMVPIRAESPVGAIGTYWARDHQPSAEQVSLLQTLAVYSATALENLELKREINKRNLVQSHLAENQKHLEFQLRSLAHDLKNPLATMIGLAQVLKSSLQDSGGPVEQEYVTRILNVAENANRQIEKILSLYRLSQTKINKQLIDLAPVALQIIDELKTQQRDRLYDIRVSPTLTAFADPDLIRLVLENLISNAFKYSSQNDLTWIRIGEVPSSKTEMKEFFIEDRGAGFDPADSKKLFQPLARLHNDAEFPGTGLGLASVARIIELHGGQVRGEGRIGQGAKFFFSLPQTN